MRNIEDFKKFLKDNYYNNEVIEEKGKITVGGYLYLRGTQIKELPDNLTVGGYLDLSGTEIKELPDNLTVGGGLDLRGTKIKDKQKEIKKVQPLKDGYCQEKNYIYYDGILWGNVKSVKRRDNITIYKTPLGYCVVEGKLSAHGKTLKQAIEDLTFKKLQYTDVSEIVREIKRTGKVTRMQYRAITGACQFGTEQFCRQHKIEDLEEISLEELRKILTPDNYGAKKFWKLIDEE